MSVDLVRRKGGGVSSNILYQYTTPYSRQVFLTHQQPDEVFFFSDRGTDGTAATTFDITRSLPKF